MWDLEKTKNTTAFDISNDFQMFLILMVLNDHESISRTKKSKKGIVREKGKRKKLFKRKKVFKEKRYSNSKIKTSFK